MRAQTLNNVGNKASPLDSGLRRRSTHQGDGAVATLEAKRIAYAGVNAPPAGRCSSDFENKRPQFRIRWGEISSTRSQMELAAMKASLDAGEIGMEPMPRFSIAAHDP